LRLFWATFWEQKGRVSGLGFGSDFGGQGGASAAPLQVRSVVKLRQQFVYTSPRLPCPKSRVSINMTE